MEGVYILSAGWGLIRSDFLTPYYDITFSQSADPYKRRRRTDRYDDFRMIPDGVKDEILFIGGKDYLPLFCQLTNRPKAKGSRFLIRRMCHGSRAAYSNDSERGRKQTGITNALMRYFLAECICNVVQTAVETQKVLFRLCSGEPKEK